jgi:peptidoglycan/xylan/chitin deacetylase (PgdA/CDA1 family)
MRAFKEAAYRALVHLVPPLGDRAAILMYHSISDHPEYFSAVTPASFEAQMEHLARSGRSVIPLAELVRRLESGEPLGGSVAITFDDGYRDNYLAAFPVLKSHGFPATVFVTTDAIGTVDKRGLEMLSESEIREMHASGLIAIEPHTKTHPIVPALAAREARAEIEESKAAIESLVRAPATIFAYPYGAYDDAIADVVRDCGYGAAVTVTEGTVSHDADPFRLPRNSVDRTTTPAQFRGKISRAVDYYEAMKALLT